MDVKFTGPQQNVPGVSSVHLVVQKQNLQSPNSHQAVFLFFNAQLLIDPNKQTPMTPQTEQLGFQFALRESLHLTVLALTLFPHANAENWFDWENSKNYASQIRCFSDAVFFSVWNPR